MTGTEFEKRGGVGGWTTVYRTVLYGGVLVLTRQKGYCLSLERDRHGKEKDEHGAM